MTTDNTQEPSKNDLLYPRAKYYREFTPEQLACNANLQEFAQRVGYLCALETGGKITALDAYQGIKQAWKALKRSKDGLKIGPSSPPPDAS